MEGEGSIPEETCFGRAVSTPEKYGEERGGKEEDGEGRGSTFFHLAARDASTIFWDTNGGLVTLSSRFVRERLRGNRAKTRRRRKNNTTGEEEKGEAPV
jgi:hypothetical protein